MRSYMEIDDCGDIWFVIDKRDLTWMEHNVWARFAHWCDLLGWMGALNYFGTKAFDRAWKQLGWPEPWLAREPGNGV